MLTHDRRLVLLALGASLPAVMVALFLLWRGAYPLPLQVALTLLVGVVWIGCTVALRRHIVYPLQTISSLLGALREDDFSIRARGASDADALGAVMLEINELADTMRAQRLGEQEATALLRGVMAEIDVAIFAFDAGRRLVLVNRYGGHLLGRPEADLLGQRADDLGLGDAFDSGSGVQDMRFPGGVGRWEIRRRPFWQGGEAHELLVLADVSQPLREQEREAWQRLIRVLGHELNNSLAPIKSIAHSLEDRLALETPPPDWREDMRQGLTVIGSRADALSRFTSAYARLARLPPPRFQSVAVGPMVTRLVSLETRLAVHVLEGPAVSIAADPDQLEQLFINVLQNAVEAARETGGNVAVGWRVHDDLLEAWVEDGGPGLQHTANLFVPFFTTKPGGSGIGLVLSRQIAEAHGGTLTLENRAHARGTRALVTLPVRAHATVDTRTVAP
jgi:nitrogen fixation/metabolism regulation signal transduction histidine kinase